MIKNILSFAAITAAFMLTASGVMAGEARPFDQEAFNQAKAEGKTVLVDFHATWCPVCKKQSEAIPQVLKEEKFKDVVAFIADYDNEKALKKQLKITGQSTLVVFKGEKEVGRERGITDPETIGKLLAKGL